MVQVSFIVLFVAAIISAKTVIPTANNATFAEMTNAHTKLFMQNIPTTVASQRSKNRFCNGRWMVRGFERSHDVLVLYLPPYSPDFNPIENVFSKLKTMLRKLKVRTIKELGNKLGKRCEIFTPKECKNYCQKAGHKKMFSRA